MLGEHRRYHIESRKKTANTNGNDRFQAGLFLLTRQRSNTALGLVESSDGDPVVTVLVMKVPGIGAVAD